MTPSELQSIWPEVRRVFAGSLGAVIASVNQDGSPHLTPIGTVALRPDCTGYYIERFPVHLPANIERDSRICVYAMRGGLTRWLWSMIRGRFDRPVAFRLKGRAGERRPLTNEERNRFLRKVRIFRWTRGHSYLWGDLHSARELVFDDCVPIRAGRMTAGLHGGSGELREGTGGDGA